jgi:hypothetical protein
MKNLIKISGSPEIEKIYKIQTLDDQNNSLNNKEVRKNVLNFYKLKVGIQDTKKGKVLVEEIREQYNLMFIEKKELFMQKWAEAKEDNEMKLFDKFSEHCDGTVDECDIDNVTLYVDIDGSIWENRVHCF